MSAGRFAQLFGIFSKSTFSLKNDFRKTIRVTNSLHPDQQMSQVGKELNVNSWENKFYYMLRFIFESFPVGVVYTCIMIYYFSNVGSPWLML